jgi:hypothetical protein
MVKISPDTSLTDKQTTSTPLEVKTQESSSCPNFASKMCLQIEYTPAQDDYFKTPMTKAIKKDNKFKASAKTLKGQHSPLTKKELQVSAMSLNTPNKDTSCHLEDSEM